MGNRMWSLEYGEWYCWGRDVLSEWSYGLWCGGLVKLCICEWNSYLYFGFDC